MEIIKCILYAFLLEPIYAAWWQDKQISISCKDGQKTFNIDKNKLQKSTVLWNMMTKPGFKEAKESAIRLENFGCDDLEELELILKKGQVRPWLYDGSFYEELSGYLMIENMPEILQKYEDARKKLLSKSGLNRLFVPDGFGNFRIPFQRPSQEADLLFRFESLQSDVGVQKFTVTNVNVKNSKFIIRDEMTKNFFEIFQSRENEKEFKIESNIAEFNTGVDGFEIEFEYYGRKVSLWAHESGERKMLETITAEKLYISFQDTWQDAQRVKINLNEYNA